MYARLSVLVTVPAALFLLVAPVGAQSSEVPGPSFEDVLGLSDIGGVAISSDGSSIAYTVTSVDWKGNRRDTEIWLVRDGHEPIQLTRTEPGSSSQYRGQPYQWESPRWSPDGEWVAFVADRGNKRQIHLINGYGGEAWALTKVESGVGGIEWSPDGTRIAFTQSEKQSEAEKQRAERTAPTPSRTPRPV